MKHKIQILLIAMALAFAGCGSGENKNNDADTLMTDTSVTDTTDINAAPADTTVSADSLNPDTGAAKPKP